MRDPLIGVMAVFGVVALIFLVLFVAFAAYDTMADNDMMDGMWEMMEDMGGMMGDDMGDMMVEVRTLRMRPSLEAAWTSQLQFETSPTHPEISRCRSGQTLLGRTMTALPIRRARTATNGTQGS